MREILFRGKQTDTGEWVYGYYYYNDTFDEHVIQTVTQRRAYRVDPETVGQYTELPDINGIKIYDGDIVRHGYTVKYADGKTSDFYDNGVVEYSESNGCYIITTPGEPHFNRLTKGTVKQNSISVIGNIYDNADLLKGGE
ncbi:MAG: YopX family protein [Candidatus Omnitrophota bacterium]